MLLGACQLIGGFQDFEAGTAAGGQGPAAQCPASVDPGRYGPAMAQVMRPDGSCFWIDRTEVTIQDYNHFLRSAEPIQDGVCAWNSGAGASLAPTGASAGLVPGADCVMQAPDEVRAALAGGPAQNLPIICVDWCDALAFCVWAGKDLCKDDGDHLASAAQSDWFEGCGGGDNTYGCGAGCAVTECNGASSKNGTLEPVDTLPGCSSSAADGGSIADLSGNAAEWSNWCSPDTATGDCLVRGGSYASNDAALECGSAVRVPRWSALPSLGFRCCSSAP
jgi:formylglycine-generating enzyme required for sulfatase activity